MEAVKTLELKANIGFDVNSEHRIDKNKALFIVNFKNSVLIRLT